MNKIKQKKLQTKMFYSPVRDGSSYPSMTTTRTKVMPWSSSRTI